VGTGSAIYNRNESDSDIKKMTYQKESR